jgi:hypothetical protein
MNPTSKSPDSSSFCTHAIALLTLVCSVALLLFIEGCGGTSSSGGSQSPPPVPASITATAGSGQSATVSTAFATNLGATVKDSSGNLISNASVTFTAPSTGASGTFANGMSTTVATTNGSGVAIASAFTANGTTGSYTVVASVSGVNSTAAFNLTNSPQATPVSITSLDKTVADPFSLITISGSGFDQGRVAISLLFIPENGNPTVLMPATASNPTTLQVPVPPLSDPISGTFASGIVDVQVVAFSTSQTLISNRISGLQINALPPVQDTTVFSDNFSGTFPAPNWIISNPACGTNTYNATIDQSVGNPSPSLEMGLNGLCSGVQSVVSPFSVSGGLSLSVDISLQDQVNRGTMIVQDASGNPITSAQANAGVASYILPNQTIVNTAVNFDTNFHTYLAQFDATGNLTWFRDGVKQAFQSAAISPKTQAPLTLKFLAGGPGLPVTAQPVFFDNVSVLRGVPIGAMTAAYLLSGLNVSASVQTAEINNPSASNLIAALAQSDADATSLISSIGTITNDPSQTVQITLANQTTATLDANMLARSDQLVQAVVSAIVSSGPIPAGSSLNCPSPTNNAVFDANLCSIQSFYQSLSGQGVAAAASHGSRRVAEIRPSDLAAAGSSLTPQQKADKALLDLFLIGVSTLVPGGLAVEITVGVGFSYLSTLAVTSGSSTPPVSQNVETVLTTVADHEVFNKVPILGTLLTEVDGIKALIELGHQPEQGVLISSGLAEPLPGGGIAVAYLDSNGNRTATLIKIPANAPQETVDTTTLVIPPQPMSKLTIAEQGSGTGSVVSFPEGISCGTSCSADFPTGVTVGLTAKASTGSSFGSWSGACSGSQSCAVAMNADETVSAAFTPSSSGPPPLTIPGPQGLTGCVDPSNGQGSVDAETLIAFGGTPLSGYAWTLQTGSTFPPGATVDSLTGVFHSNGAAPTFGTFNFNMTVSDGTNTASGSFQLVVSSSTPCGFSVFQQSSLTTFSLPNGSAGAGYGSGLFVVGGTPPYSWGLATGSLPPGLLLDTVRGTLHGTIFSSASGQTFSFTLSVTDSTKNVAICPNGNVCPTYQIIVQ